MAQFSPVSESTPPSVQPATHHWGRWALLGFVLLILVALGWLKWGLDPWLRGKLEKEVTTKTHGQYALHVAGLYTQLLARSLQLRGVTLRPTTPNLADTLPRLSLHLARLDVSGVGLLALLRGHTAPIDSLTLDSLHLDVAALARRPAPHPTPPFYQQHPLRLGHLALRRVGGSFGPAGAPVGQLREATVRAHDLLITSAGAADTQRLAFAAGWQAVLRQLEGKLGGHTITAQLVNFSSDRQFFGLDSLRIAPPAPGQGKPGAVRISLTIPGLRVRGLQAAAWQHLHRLRADSTLLVTPRLTFRPPAQAPPPLWQLLKPVFRRADLGQLVISDGYMAVVGVGEKPEVRHLFGVARSLRIDSAAGQPGARRVLYARNWQGHTGRITALFQPPVYPASIEHALLNTEKQSLRLTGLALRPTLSAAQLNRYSGFQTTQLRVLIPELRAEKFDFYRFSDDSHILIGRVVAERPYLETHSDGRGPISKSPSILTPEAMRGLHAHIDVRQLEARNGTIAAVYRSARTPLLGTFIIKRLHVTLHNVSNEQQRMSLAHPLTGEATGYLQNQCRTQVHLTTSLLDPQGRQHLWGSFGPAPLSLLNSFVTPTRLVAIKSGQVQSITFDEHLDRQRVSGPIRATYTDLKIDYLGYKDGKVKKTLLNRVKSGLVNGLVIRDQNPRPGGRFVVGKMSSRRELQFSTFTAWRQGLLCGLLQSVGVPDKLAQKYSQSSDPTPLPPAGAR